MSQELDGFIASIEKEAGLKIGEDVLAAFGNQWAMYTDRDVATTSILENFIDETEKRTWFLFEATRLTNQPEIAPSPVPTARPINTETGAGIP